MDLSKHVMSGCRAALITLPRISTLDDIYQGEGQDGSSGQAFSVTLQMPCVPRSLSRSGRCYLDGWGSR